jgi:hypothetical protein
VTPAIFGLTYVLSFELKQPSDLSVAHHFVRFVAALAMTVYLGVQTVSSSPDDSTPPQTASATGTAHSA